MFAGLDRTFRAAVWCAACATSAHLARECAQGAHVRFQSEVQTCTSARDIRMRACLRPPARVVRRHGVRCARQHCDAARYAARERHGHRHRHSGFNPEPARGGPDHRVRLDLSLSERGGRAARPSASGRLDRSAHARVLPWHRADADVCRAQPRHAVAPARTVPQRVPLSGRHPGLVRSARRAGARRRLCRVARHQRHASRAGAVAAGAEAGGGRTAGRRAGRTAHAPTAGVQPHGGAGTAGDRPECRGARPALAAYPCGRRRHPARARSRAGAAARPRRPWADRADPDEPGGERARCHGSRRHRPHRDRECHARPGLRAWPHRVD